jgi:hypothetical protein
MPEQQGVGTWCESSKVQEQARRKNKAMKAKNKNKKTTKKNNTK